MVYTKAPILKYFLCNSISCEIRTLMKTFIFSCKKIYLAREKYIQNIKYTYLNICGF